MLIVEKLAVILCLNLSLKGEEGRKRHWREGVVPENLRAAALDHGDCGSPLTRRNRKPGAQQSPGVDSKEQDGSECGDIIFLL